MTPGASGWHAAPMSEVPLEIDGMEVLVDRRVTLFPVTLVEVPPPAKEQGQDVRPPAR